MVTPALYSLIKSDTYRRLSIACFVLGAACLGRDRGSALAMTGYEWFCSRQLAGGWAMIPLPVFVADYVAAEHTNHAFVLELLCGYTRKEIIGAKGIVCMAGIAGLGLMNTIAGVLVTTLFNGFGAAFHETTVAHMATILIYYILGAIVNVGAVPFLVAVMTESKIGTITLGLCAVQFVGVATAQIPYILDRMKESCWKNIIDNTVQLLPIYQVDSILNPQKYKPHPYWLFFVSCSVCLIIVNRLSIYFLEKVT